jgi:succinylglutamic semialdehyde dehydrogenase
LSDIRKFKMQETLGHYIAGKWVTGGATEFSSVNPATGKTIWQGHNANPMQIEQAIIAAREAFAAWMNLSFEARYNYLHKFNQELTAQQESLAEILSQETGKPLWEAKTELSAMIGKLDISKQAYLERCKEVNKDMNGVASFTRHKPHGVILVLAPFNFPCHLPNGHIIPALLAGNTLIIKPSELTPYISAKIMEVWDKAGLPEGVINMLQGDGSVGKVLVEHKEIDAVFFTGSSGTGAKIAASILTHPNRILALEMGGNNPLVVSQPGDIDAAVYNTIQSAFITAGQRCTCARRLIVLRDADGEKFVQRLIEVTQKLKVGPYTDKPEAFMGSVISNNAADTILNAYQTLVGLGAKVLVPITRPEAELAILTPGIIDVTAITNQPDEEIFGPLLRLTWVDDFASAIREANNTKYGLVAGLLSSNSESYKQFYQQVRAGIINWNRPTTGASSAAPFGGIGKSGNHRPSAYYAADYCAYPVASLEEANLKLPVNLSPGITL